VLARTRTRAKAFSRNVKARDLSDLVSHRGAPETPLPAKPSLTSLSTGSPSASAHRAVGRSGPEKAPCASGKVGPELRERNGDTQGAWTFFFRSERRFSMARVLVMNEKRDRILLDEYVHPVHIEDEHVSLQILERLAWAIKDASQPEQVALGS